MTHKGHGAPAPVTAQITIRRIATGMNTDQPWPPCPVSGAGVDRRSRPGRSRRSASSSPRVRAAYAATGPLIELVDVEPAGRGVLAQQRRGVLALAVRGAQRGILRDVVRDRVRAVAEG